MYVCIHVIVLDSRYQVLGSMLPAALSNMAFITGIIICTNVSWVVNRHCMQSIHWSHGSAALAGVSLRARVSEMSAALRVISLRGACICVHCEITCACATAEMCCCWSVQDVVFNFLTTDEIQLNQIDAEDPEVADIHSLLERFFSWWLCIYYFWPKNKQARQWRCIFKWDKCQKNYQLMQQNHDSGTICHWPQTARLVDSYSWFRLSLRRFYLAVAPQHKVNWVKLYPYLLTSWLNLSACEDSCDPF